MVKSKSRKSKSKRGWKADRARVSVRQKYEVAYEAKKSKKTRKQVRAAVKKVGSSRKKVRRELAG